jgi:hypothetical protein
MKSRAIRRAQVGRFKRKWLKRLRIKRRRWQLDSQKLELEAKRRVDTHEDIRNHPRKTCSICNPVYKRLAEQRELDRDYANELKLLSLNLHDLLRPTPD